MPIKSINKKLIITIGSSRYSHDFETSIPLKSKQKYKIYHVSDEDERGKARSPKAILKQVLSVSKKGDPRAVISFARSTVIGSVENVAKVLEDLKKEKGIRDYKLIGPSFIAAKTLSNKWLAAKSMKRLKYSVLKTICVNGSNLNNIYKRLKTNLFSLPAIIKATYLSGGAGMRFVQSPQDLISQYKLQRKQKIVESILTEFLVGPEVSVEMLYLGTDIFVFPMSVKDPTNESLDHGDNKVKIAGYINPIVNIQTEAVDIAKKYCSSGYFAIEGIVYNLKKRQWKIMEGTPRFTGSYPMFNATLSHFETMKAIFKYIDAQSWIPSPAPRQQVVMQIPIFSKSVSRAEKVVNRLKQLDWIVFARVEDLSKLPFSEDNRIRIQITFKAGGSNDLQKRISVMQKIANDKTIEGRIVSSIKRLDEYFPDLVHEKSIYKKFLAGK